MFLRVSVVFIFIVRCTLGISQGVEFYAQADAQQIIAGNYFEVTFTLENAKGNSFSAPSFDGFEVLSGPSRSTQMSVINGRTSQKMSFSYGLTILKPGKQRIGFASIRANGITYKSQPVDITAVEGKNQLSSSSKKDVAVNTGDFFVEAQLDQDTGYIGQQISLKYVLYTTKDVRSVSFSKAPKFDGFFAQEIQNYRDRPQRVIRDGVQYVSRTIKLISLFPQQKGTFSTGPAQINLGISTKSGRSSFFFNSNLRTVRVNSDSFDVTITDLPDSAPSSFAGAIGDFYLGTAIDKKRLSMDDALTMTYQIKGDGDGKLLSAPELPLGDLFDIYEPNLLREETKIEGTKVVTTKTYEYLMIPKNEGPIIFNPELSFFDLETQQYKTITGETYRIQVLPSTRRQTVDLDTRKIELPPPFTETTLILKNQFFFGSTPYWIANGSIGLTLLGLLIAKKIKVDLENRDPAEVKNAKAKKLAIQQLSEAKNAWQTGDTKQFYILLRKGLLDYLTSKTFHPTTQLTKDEIIDLLAQNNLSLHQTEIMDIMQKGEMAIYANMSPGTEQENYDKALQIIQNMESSYK